MVFMCNFSGLIDDCNPESLPLESDPSNTVLGSFRAIALIVHISKIFLSPIKRCVSYLYYELRQMLLQITAPLLDITVKSYHELH